VDMFNINRFNWRTYVISLSILACLVLANYGNTDKVYVANNENMATNNTEAFMVPVAVEPKPTIEDKIRQYFPRSWRDMVAIAHAESGMQENAKNWNCWYNKDKTIVYATKVKGSHSAACKKQHRAYSYSVDCGILQLNVKGKECPIEDIDTHLEKAAELSKVQGKQAWVVYKTGAYRKHLNN